MKFIALFRGVNVGGHHKVPISDLKIELAQLGCGNIKTILNSGNAVFEIEETNTKSLQDKIEHKLKVKFGFSIPTILIEETEFRDIISLKPFDEINVNENLQLYVSFLKENPIQIPELPHSVLDSNFRILAVNERTIFSVLDVSKIQTPKGMTELEKRFGKEITTRNWNTVLKIGDLVK